MRDTAYYLDDAYKGSRYVDLDCFVDEIKKDKMTELSNIAFELGARECRLESFESEKETGVVARVAAVKLAKAVVRSASASAESSYSSLSEKRMLFSRTFEGSDSPRDPELDWYKHDKEIKSLISMRCSEGGNKIKEYSVELKSFTSGSISSATASKIDAALAKVGISGNAKFEKKVSKESRRELVFHIVF